MLITDIKKQIKNDGRFNIYLDGQYYCPLTAEVIMVNKLKIGQETERDFIDKLHFESEKATAFTKSVNYMGSRLKTQKQLIDYLSGKGYGQQIVDYVMAKLKEYEFIDDKNYAEAYIASVQSKKGGKLIAMELKRRGVSEELIEQKLDEVSEEDEEQSALSVGRKYIKNKEKDLKTKNKLYNYLYSKGFSGEICARVVKELCV